MKRVKFCPKCMNIIGKKDTECSACGMKVEDMKIEDVPTFMPKKKKKEKEIITDENGNVLSKKEIKKLQEQKEINFEEAFFEEEENPVETESVNQPESTEENETKPKRHKHKSKKKDAPEFSVNETGEYSINTKDVTFFEKQEEYSVKKARGDYEPEKLKWWEIYKWADRMLARRKIKKEVNKAATVRPEFISKTKMLLLCLFFGWMGAHNFYARNKAKGWTIVGMLIAMVIIVKVPALNAFMGVFVGGGCGFVVLCMWLIDIFAIITNRYRYRITKMQFIKKLNVETRAKLGKKYIDIK